MFIGKPWKIIEDDTHPDWAPSLNLPKSTAKTDRQLQLDLERHSRRLWTKEKKEQLANVKIFCLLCFSYQLLLNIFMFHHS